jgi:hypothetical protein
VKPANLGHPDRAFFTQNLCGRAISIPRFYSRTSSMRTGFQTWTGAMDIVYLLFLFVLSGATLGFLLICDRLGMRK